METKNGGYTVTRRHLGHLCVPAVCLAIAGTGCRGKHQKVYIEDDEKETDPQPVSTFKMSDPAAGRQLIGGFYNLEGKSWRWTKRNFAISFRTPPDATRRGATVSLDLVIPDVVIQKLGTVRLAAAIRGRQIGAEQHTSPGSWVFKADAPAELCGGANTLVDFHLEKALPPSPGDERELGVIVTAATLATR